MTDAGALTADARVMVSVCAKPDVQSWILENPDAEVPCCAAASQRASMLSSLDGARAGRVGSVDPPVGFDGAARAARERREPGVSFSPEGRARSRSRSMMSCTSEEHPRSRCSFSTRMPASVDAIRPGSSLQDECRGLAPGTDSDYNDETPWDQRVTRRFGPAAPKLCPRRTGARSKLRRMLIRSDPRRSPRWPGQTEW